MKALIALPALGGDRALAERLILRREEAEKGLIVSAPELPSEECPTETYESLDYRPYREILAESLLLAAGEIGLPLDAADARAAADSMPAWEPFPDTLRALEEIRKVAPIAILSNVEEEVIQEAIRKLGVPFDLVVTAERVEAYKPAPDHWYAAMHELQADEEELFHLAASPFHDLETACLLGIPCGFVNRDRLPLLPEASPAFVVPDLAGAAKILAKYPGTGRGGGRETRAGGPPRPPRAGR
jgi:2-haloalkanoic acid dehalogenase type II